SSTSATPFTGESTRRRPQKSRLLRPATKLMSDKFAGANLADRRSARRVTARDRPSQKRPQAVFPVNQGSAHRAVRGQRSAAASARRTRESPTYSPDRRMTGPRRRRNARRPRSGGGLADDHARDDRHQGGARSSSSGTVRDARRSRLPPGVRTDGGL